MEGGLFLVFIIIALVARAIEAMTKGKNGPQGPPPQRRPRPQYERPHGTTTLPRRAPGELPSGQRPEPARPSAEDAATAMIPDDLWEILTGTPKPRPAPAPPPQRQPEPVYAEADADEEAGAFDVARDETAEYERRRRLEEAQRQLEHEQLLDRRRRGEEMYTADKAPEVYSLERPLPPAAVRHAAFHEKVDVPVVVRPRARRPPARAWLFSGDDMKRAIVLQEVLGRPKGLE